jgi:hypothetical protein
MRLRRFRSLLASAVLQEHTHVADTLAEVMDLEKIGPAEMDSVTRLAFAQKVQLRMQALDEKLAAAEAARQARLARRAGGGGHAGCERGRDALEAMAEDGGGGGDEEVVFDLGEAAELAAELHKLHAEMEEQRDFLRRFDEVEAKYAQADGPQNVPIPGGHVTPPMFPHERENPFVLDLKGSSTTPAFISASAKQAQDEREGGRDREGEREGGRDREGGREGGRESSEAVLPVVSTATPATSATPPAIAAWQHKATQFSWKK